MPLRTRFTRWREPAGDAAILISRHPGVSLNTQFTGRHRREYRSILYARRELALAAGQHDVGCLFLRDAYALPCLGGRDFRAGAPRVMPGRCALSASGDTTPAVSKHHLICKEGRARRHYTGIIDTSYHAGGMTNLITEYARRRGACHGASAIFDMRCRSPLSRVGRFRY